MDANDRARTLFRHGTILVLAGLLMGGVVQAVANPRIGLSAHTGTVMAGIWVSVLGAVWPRLALSTGLESVAFWGLVAGNYLSSVGVFLAGVFGTSRSTPLHGAGHAGTAWQEALVEAVLVIGAIGVLAGSVIVIHGLRRPR